MRRFLFLFIFLIVFLGCFSTPEGSSSNASLSNNTPRFTGIINDTALNNAIVESYRYLRQRVPNDAVIGIANFSSPTRELSDYYVDGLSKQIVDGGIYKLVDIGNLRIIEQEMTRQLSGNVSDATAKRIGQQYGTDFIIIGNISQLGTTRTYRIKITITNVETTEIQGIFYADIRSNNELARFLPENNSTNRNLPLENTSNPNQRIYYFRNITFSQFNELYRTFSIEADDVRSSAYFNANLIDGGTYDPYIEYAIKGDGYREVRTVTIAGPYFSEVYTYSFSEDYNRGSSIYKDRILPRFNIEKSILNGKYGNPNISMFFKQ